MASAEQDLAEDIASFYDDMRSFVTYVFPWGEKGGPLEHQEGPDEWQIIVMDEISAEVKKGDLGSAVRLAVSSGHGIGKGHPVDMPYRDGVWGDLKKGDSVFNAEGNKTIIKAVNNYRREHFKVTFDDGSSVITSGQHEWNVRGRHERRNNLDTWRTLETEQILDMGVRRPNGVAMSRQWEIPVQGAVDYPSCEVQVDAYTYGVWLGDGNKSSGRITNTDKEVWDNVAYLWNPKIKGITRTLWGLKTDLKDNNLFGCTTYNASVDVRYINSDQRLNVLQGLLDTDGWVEQCGSPAFCSASKQLVRDVVKIARSLGLKAREEKFKDNDCSGAWYTHITWDGETELFRIKRKQDKLIKAEHRYQCRWIESIESVGLMDGMCIEVEGGLYLTDDFHVTHNSALVAWIILWFVSTRPHPQIVVTANTQNQLTNKTWRELAKWHRLSLNKDWFQWTATKFYLKEHPETWYASAIPWSEKNSEAFAGTHEEHVMMIFDEASAVADCIWEVCEGAMTTPGALWICFGNPTRNNGRFYQCFNEFSHRWITHHVDSRNAKMANRAQLDEWVEDYGEDSDFVRVRVRGVFPRAGSSQFIANDTVDQCNLYKAEGYEKDSKILGVDVARFGDNKTVIHRRQGRKNWKPKKFLGLDTMEIASQVAKEIMEWSPDAVFIDGAGVGGGVVDRLKQLGFNVIEVQAGGSPEDKDRYVNKRIECWARANDYLKVGAELPGDVDLNKGLCGPEYYYNAQNKLQLEKKEDMKQRGMDSPDEADAFTLTFAERVLTFAGSRRKRRPPNWRTV